ECGLQAAAGMALLLLAALLPAGCRSRDIASPPAPGEFPPGSSVRFVDVTEQAGIRWRHVSGQSGRFYFPETMGSGCAFLDYDGDGQLDLFLVNSTRLPGFTGQGPFYSALYRNSGDGTFKDVTKRAGLAVDCYGMGVAVGDYDNDGDPDLYLTALGPNRLFRNEGDGTFTDVTKQAGVGDPRFSSSAAWFDYDRDGDLDLFVCNYCRWTPATNRVCPDSAGRKHMCNPSFFPGSPSALYRNDGDGTFTDVTQQAGVSNPTGKALGVVVFDVDHDGLLDLLIANDLEPNTLYRNQGNGTFTEMGVEAGVAYGPRGRARAGMGIDTADLAGEGREDVLIGNFSGERAALFRDGGGGQFVDVAPEVGLGEASFPYTTFGAMFVDYDLDGQKDICLINGHPDPNIGLAGSGPTFAQNLALFRNEGGQFGDVTAQSGPGFRGQIVGRGLSVGDFDGDGDPDLLVTENNGPARLLRNEGGSGNHWLAIRLRGTKSNREGLGTRIVVQAGGRRQSGWVRSGSSYCSDNEHVARFGLGPATQVDQVELHWPSGIVQTLRGVKADQVLALTEPSD
ncbi:MAG TPA: CRTAC1 family protein, partial [Gemmatimonadales bacterium]|nr:CRTAC1 family protein [Gemmatimonadales bacterium]